MSLNKIPSRYEVQFHYCHKKGISSTDFATISERPDIFRCWRSVDRIPQIGEEFSIVRHDYENKNLIETKINNFVVKRIINRVVEHHGTQDTGPDESHIHIILEQV
jgi:hypothetical protein